MADLNLNVPAIDKLLDYTASGIGAVAGPLFLPWKAWWEGKAKRISARTDADVRLLQAESEAGTSPIIAKARSEAREYLVTPDAHVRGTLEITRDDIIQRIAFQERKRHTNIKAAVVGAADELGDKEVSDHEPDADWTARFFDCVQDVSSEDMRKIWAKLLAGEVESPGRTSLRTLDALRNMTKKDAEIFREVCDFVINGDFVFYNDSVQDLDGLNYTKLIHLQDCQLVTAGQGLVTKLAWGEPPHIRLTHHGGFLELSKENRSEKAQRELEIPVVVLTTAGQELSQLAQGYVDMKYLRALARFLKSKGSNLAYTKKVEPSTDDSGDFATITLIKP